MAPSVALDAEERPSSPENDSPVRVKRAVRTYGRARPANETHATASFAPKAISPQSLVASASLSTSILRARPSESDLASDDDNEDAAAPSKFTWDWKKKLDNWDSDEGDGEQDEFANGAASENGPHDGRAAHDTPDVSLDASDLASSARTLIERSPLKQPIHSSQSSLGDSPLALHKPKPRQSRIADSDDEEQVISKPAKTSVISRDTPSDSDDELPTTVTISPRRKPTSKCQAPKPPTKDDGRSRPATRKAAASQSAKVKPSRVKAPSKKQRQETEKESWRLAANRNSSLRADEQERTSKYTKANLFGLFANAVGVAKEPPKDVKVVDGAALPPPVPSSDPIDEFSSPLVLPPSQPITAQPRAQHARSQRPQVQPLPLLDTLKKAESDSDDDMPDLAEVSRQVEDDERKSKLRLIKEQALRRKSKPPASNSDDDDLVVVGRHTQGLQNGAAKGPTRNQQALNTLGVRPLRAAPAPGQPSNNKKDLDRLLLEKAQAQAAALARRKEEAFLREGGRLAAPGIAETSERSLEEVLEEGRRAAQNQLEVNVGMDVDEDEDENDEEYVPEDQPAAASDDDSGEIAPVAGEGDADTTMVEDDDEHVALVRPRRRQVIGVDSDEEDSPADENQNPFLQQQRRSVSTFEDSPSDELDKENEVPPPPMFDLSDQENTAPTRPPLRHSMTNLARDLHSTLSMSPGAFHSENAEDIGSPVAGPSTIKRKPLTSIETDDDPFASPLGIQRSTSFAERLQQSVGHDDEDIPGPSKRGADFVADEQDGFSQALGGGFKPMALESSFSALFDSGTQKAPALTFGEPLALGGGLSFDSEKNGGFENLRQRNQPSLGLTQDISAQPAIAVSQSKLRQADEIFEKEQIALVEAAIPQHVQQEEPLYINDHGFLTQTRPDLPSPQVHRAFSPQSATKTQSTVAPEPFSPVSFGRQWSQWEMDDLDAVQPSQHAGPSSSQDSPGPMRRLRRREGSMGPPPLRNAFAVLKANASKSKAPKARLEKSEYVEAEAAESDDEADFGGRGSGDEADGEDLDQTLAEIVDDSNMTEEQLAQARIEELAQQQRQEEDAKLEEKVQGVIKGDYRKRKRAGHDLYDDDDELADEEREERNAMARKRAREEALDNRTDLRSLREREETRPFAIAYTGTLDEEDADDFAYLAKDSGSGLRLHAEDTNMGDADDESDEDEEERRPIKASEVQAQLRELAQRTTESDDEGEPIDIDALIDPVDDDDGDMRVRIVKTVPTRAPVMDGDVDFQSRQATFDNAPHLVKWAKHEQRKQGGTGRATTSATITGNKVKSGGGSLRPGQSAEDARRQQLETRRRPLNAAPSVLAGVSRAARFGP